MNLFDYHIPAEGEIFTALFERKGLRIERIVSSDRLPDKEYCQEEDEWVVLLEGEAVLLVEGQEKRMRRGDSLFLPARTRHRVIRTTSGTLWLAVHIHSP